MRISTIAKQFKNYENMQSRLTLEKHVITLYNRK